MQHRIVVLGIAILSVSPTACGWIVGIDSTTTDQGTCEGCDIDGDGFCAEGIDATEFPNTCIKGGNDCDDMRDSVFPGAEDQCGASDFNCDQKRPLLAFSDPSVIRGTPGSAVGEELSYNGNEFAAIWAEDTEFNRTAKVATLSASGTVVDGPVALTGPNVAASQTAIDWDATSGRWGALYVTASAKERGFTLELTTLDTNLLSPETFSLGPVNSNLVRIVGANGFFVLFYSKNISSQSGVYFRSFNTATKTLSTERLLTVNKTSLSGSSIAWAGGSQIMLAWDDFDSSQTPRRAVNIAVVTASGGVQAAYSRHTFPGNEEGERPTVHAANSKFYLIWEFPNSSTSATSSDYFLRVSEVTTSGGFTGATQTIADNAMSFGGRTLVAESSTIVGLLYMGIDVPAGSPFPQATYLGRFDTSWVLQSRAPTWFSSIDFTHSRAVHGYFRSNEYYVMDTGGTTGYFIVYGVDRNNPGAPTSGVEREPITPGTFSSKYGSSPLTVSYDAGMDAITVMQQNTNDASLLETYHIDATGVASTPVSFGPTAPSCFNYQLEGDGVGCYSQQPNFDEIMCFLPFPGTFEPRYNLTHQVFANGNWTSTVLSELPGFYDEFGRFCFTPDVRFPVLETTAGLVAVVGVPVGQQFIEGFDWQKHLFSPMGAHTVEVIKAHQSSESVSSPLVTSRDDRHYYAYTVADTTMRQLFVQRIAHATGMLDGPPIEVASIPSTNSGLFLESIHHNGDKLGVVYAIRDSSMSPAVDTPKLVFVDDSGAVTPSVVIPDVQNINLVLVGDSGYNVIVEPSNFGQRVRVYDDNGNALETGTLEYTATGTPTLQLFHTGHDFRALLRTGNRVLHAGGTCKAQ